MTKYDHIGPSLVISIHLWQSPTTRAWSNKLIQISNFLVNQSINVARCRGAFAPKNCREAQKIKQTQSLNNRDTLSIPIRHSPEKNFSFLTLLHPFDTLTVHFWQHQVSFYLQTPNAYLRHHTDTYTTIHRHNPTRHHALPKYY